MVNYFELINEIISYIENNIDSDITTSSIAAEFHYSKYHISRIFNSVAGISIEDYTLKRRLTLAAGEILSGRKIIDVAVSYGYHTHYGFTKAFKQQFGILPSEVSRSKDIKNYHKIILAEREFKNIKGDICVCFDMNTMHKTELYGRMYTARLCTGAEWNIEMDKVEKGVREFMSRYLSNSPDKKMYGIALPGTDENSVHFFIAADTPITGLESFTVPGAQYAVFTYHGNIKDIQFTVINDVKKCFAKQGLILDNHFMDHIEVFNGDYFETGIFKIMAPLKANTAIQ